MHSKFNLDKGEVIKETVHGSINSRRHLPVNQFHHEVIKYTLMLRRLNRFTLCFGVEGDMQNILFSKL